MSNKNDIDFFVEDCIWHDVKVSWDTAEHDCWVFRLENFWSTADKKVLVISLGNWLERQEDRCRWSQSVRHWKWEWEKKSCSTERATTPRTYHEHRRWCHWPYERWSTRAWPVCSADLRRTDQTISFSFSLRSQTLMINIDETVEDRKTRRNDWGHRVEDIIK